MGGVAAARSGKIIQKPFRRLDVKKYFERIYGAKVVWRTIADGQQFDLSGICETKSRNLKKLNLFLKTKQKDAIFSCS